MSTPSAEPGAAEPGTAEPGTAEPGAARPPRGPVPRRALWSWAVYDWATNGFATVILTFVFSAYFAREVAPSATEGTSLWGWMLSLSGLAIAVLSPIAGAVADNRGRLKRWLGAATATCVVATAALWWIEPDPADAVPALVLVGLGTLSFHLALVFYDSQLPALVPPSRIGRWSGWAWGLGYAGGLSCLALSLVLFVRADNPLIPLDTAAAEHVRVVGPFVALWFALFALPLFLLTPDRPSTGLSLGAATRRGLAQLADTVRKLRAYRNIVRFLIARILYIDGLNTLFSFGGIYVAGTFGMEVEEVLLFGIALNVTAGLGAALFGFIDDIIGPRRTILVGLGGLLLFGSPLLVIESEAWLWALALPMGLFIGPTQSASRSLMVRLAPPDLTTEMFGFFQASGKLTAFVGPALVAAVTAATASQRIGLAPVLVLVILGGIVLIGVKEPAARPDE